MIELSEKLKVPVAKKPVTYRLLGAGMPHQITKRPMYKSPSDWVGSETIHDPGDKDRPRKLLMYVENSNIVEGKLIETAGRIEFGGPENQNSLTVKPENYNLLVYMERSNYNLSNPFRDKSVPAKYERIDNEKIAEKDEETAELALEAQLVLRNMPEADLYAFAKAVNVNADQSAIELRRALRKIAIAKPQEFIDKSGSQTVKVKAEIYDATQLQLIKYDYQTNTYVWGLSGGEILSVPLGQDAPSYLADHFLNDPDGELQYKELLAQMNQEEKPKKKGKKE